MRKARRRSSLRPWRLIVAGIIAAAAVLAIMWVGRLSTDDARDCTDEEIALAAEAGRKAAQTVSALPEGSMQREGAILHLRARETDIRRAGYPSAADAFARAAGDVLAEAGIILATPGQ